MNGFGPDLEAFVRFVNDVVAVVVLVVVVGLPVAEPPLQLPESLPESKLDVSLVELQLEQFEFGL